MVFVPAKSKKSDNFNLTSTSEAASSRHAAELNVWQKIGLAVLSGALLALSSPGFDQWWLAWFMLAPFFVLLTKCRSNSDSLLCGLFFGMSYHLLALRSYLGLYANTSLAHGYDLLVGQSPFIIWFMQAALLSLPVLAFAWLVYTLPLRPGYLPYLQRPFFPYLISVPLLWIFLHRGLAIAYPLASLWQFAPLPPVAIDALSYSQYSQLPIIQSAKVLGPFAIEFLLLLVNAAIASFLLELVEVQDRPVERVDLISPRLGAVMDLTIAVVLVGLVCFWGHGEVMRLIFSGSQSNLAEINQPKIPVGILNGNVFDASSASSLNRVKDTAPSLEILVLPEPGRKNNFSTADNVLDLLKKTVRQNHNAAITSFILSSGKNESRQNFVFTPSGNLHSEQNLSYPADTSFLSIQSLPASLKEWFLLSDKNELASPYPVVTAKINWGKIGFLSGSEIISPQVAANLVRQGASLIVCDSNISWTRDSFLSKQLLAAAVMRAVETGRYILLTTDETVMAIIGPNGLINSLSLPSPNLSRSESAEKSGMILGTVQFLWSKTPFTKMWWL